MSLLGAGLGLAAGVVLLSVVTTTGIDPLQAGIERATFILTGIRVIALAGILVAWPTILTTSRRLEWIDANQQQRLRSMRRRLVFWFVALELVLGLDTNNHLLEFMRGLLS